MELAEKKINRVVDQNGSIWEEVIETRRKEVFSPLQDMRNTFEACVPTVLNSNAGAVTVVKGESIRHYSVYFPDYMTIRSPFKVSADGQYLIPTRDSSADIIPQNPFGLTSWLGYKPVYIVIHHPGDISLRKTLEYGTAYLMLAVREGSKIIFKKPPLSNIYGDGKICFGALPPHKVGGHLATELSEYMRESMSNMDLAEDGLYELFARIRIADSVHCPDERLVEYLSSSDNLSLGFMSSDWLKAFSVLYNRAVV